MQKLSNFTYLNLSIFHFVFFLSDFSIVKETFHILWEKSFLFLQLSFYGFVTYMKFSIPEIYLGVWSAIGIFLCF